MSIFVNNGWTNATLLNTGIAWDSDKDIKFQNPKGDLKTIFENNYAKPKAWKKEIWQLDENNPYNNGKF